ncbi:hypothetical protein [uncultured Clostridium sp.]|nr:hypothetical protein [uncultured Clostridium sp.]
MDKNNKKNRTDGVINSANTKFPTPQKSFNNKTSNYEFTDDQKIRRQSYS